MEHQIIFQEKDRFAGWPANNGVWIWEGREILVGFVTGGYQVQKGHNISEPYQCLLSRSLDGGKSWQMEAPSNFIGMGQPLAPLRQAIDFQHPGFAMRVFGAGYHGADEKRGGFFFSYDRGKTWSGPYFLAGLAQDTCLKDIELTPRTDYLVEGPHTCLVMLSARQPDAWGSDKIFCARTTDGGRTFNFLSWIVPPEDAFRAVMPCTVRYAGQELVSVIRRRQMGTNTCWIDAYGSQDAGASWSFLSRVGDTGQYNGNPPALVRLQNGRLCCVYGQRTRRQMIAQFSEDAGITWGQEYMLRDDYESVENDGDLGYPRLVQTASGQLVAMYYWADKGNLQEHIAATIWAPTP
ncbi:MAG: exo-alpha-sialidase [Chloroflexi bacterium]|nr:exo-alpha-sialidase [Chloroflexota bacterium]